MVINEQLRNKLATLAVSEEWKQVSEEYFKKQVDDLLYVNRELDILPKDSNLQLDYKDVLLARRVAGMYLKSILDIVELCKVRAQKVKDK